MSPRTTLTLSNLSASAYFPLIVFIVTPYLALYFPDSITGLSFSLGALLTLMVFPFMPALVRRYGTRTLARLFTLLLILGLTWLSLSPTPVPAFIFIALVLGIAPLLAYQLDLLLEATISQEGDTGRVRALFLTAGSAVAVVAPLVVGLLLDSTEEYWRVFLFAAISLIPFLFLISFKCLPQGESPKLVTMVQASLMLLCDRDLRGVVLSHGVLQLFYHTAPLFIALYLHHILLISWSMLGWMFMIMLLPFVLIEYPAGWLADRKWGDKEMLLAGFAIMGLGFAALAFVNENTMILVITAILFVSRVGASLVEAMTEGHFFRRVSEADASTVGIFRVTRPIAALLGPIIGSIFLVLFGYQGLFIGIGLIIAVLGIFAGRMITDIKVQRGSV